MRALSKYLLSLNVYALVDFCNRMDFAQMAEDVKIIGLWNWKLMSLQMLMALLELGWSVKTEIELYNCA